MSIPHPQRTHTQFSPSPDAYAFPSPLKGEEVWVAPTKLSPYTPNCHAELVSASLFRPTESRPRYLTHKGSPDFGAFCVLTLTRRLRVPLSPQGRGACRCYPQRPRPGLSFALTLTRRLRVPLSPQGRGNFSRPHQTVPLHTKLSCRINIKLSCRTCFGISYILQTKTGG